VAGYSGHFTPGSYLSAVIHTALSGIEPTTFRLLIRRATSAAETINVLQKRDYKHSAYDFVAAI